MPTERTPLMEEHESQNGENKPGCGKRFRDYISSPKFGIYCSTALSAWGDRMWSFAVGLFLVEIDGSSLQLTAIYGFTTCILVMLFGAIIGDWVDRNPRLKVARTSLFIQNTCVIGCAVTLCLMLLYRDELPTMMNGALYIICQAIVIVLADMANLASIAYKIALQRDWIIEVAGRDKHFLTNMSAIVRRIDLVTNIVAPVAVGQIMTFTTMFFGAIFIAGWNLVSVFIEYYILTRVYKKCPALANKIYKDKKDKLSEKIEEEPPGGNDNEVEPSTSSENAVVEIVDPDKHEKKNNSICSRMFSGFITLYSGWGIFMRQNIKFAGIGLAFLYMTVLGFDNVTTGYSYSQGISESVLSIMMALGAVFGVFGTLGFPFLRGKIGLTRTGLIALHLQLLCLTMCVASVWAPGSSFNLFGTPHNETQLCPTTADNFTTVLPNVTIPTCQPGFKAPDSYVSLGLLMGGIITARFGLWMADLSITQLFLENVHETERGIVNGVQNSLNQLMDMLKFAMVIAAPNPETFGLLVCISFGFVMIGYFFYLAHVKQDRKHIFHFKEYGALYIEQVYSRRQMINPELGIFMYS